MREWRFTCLDTTILVQAGDLLPHDLLDALLDGYPASEAPWDRRYRLEQDERSRSDGDDAVLVIDDEPPYRARVADCINAVALNLYSYAIWCSRSSWLLHAAALSNQEHTLILAGPSGAGKSTLTRHLLSRGWRYLSEEIAAVDATRVRGLLRPLHSDSLSELESLPGLRAPIRTEPGELYVAQAAQPIAERPLEEAIFVRLSHHPSEPTEWVRLPAKEALETLWDCRMNTGAREAHTASRVLSKRPAYRLRTENVPTSLSALDEIVADASSSLHGSG